MIDVIVTRKEDDPTHYRHMVSMCRDATLIEVPFAASVTEARQRLVDIGTSEYLTWFDPDDKLYCYALPQIAQALKLNPQVIGALTLSDYQLPTGKKRTIQIQDFARRPVDGHWFRVFKREWLAQNVELFDYPVNEWPVTAKAIEDGALFLNIKSYCWIVGEGDHKRLTPQDIHATRQVVRQILGDKYTKLVEQYRK